MKFISSQDENVPKGLYSHCGVYLHGKLEDDIGYDVPILLDNDMKVGINKCDVQFPDGKKVKAKAYVWKTDFPINPWGVRGLIIYDDDEDKEYVMKQYKQKSENL